MSALVFWIMVGIVVWLAVVGLFICVCIAGHDEDVREHQLLQQGWQARRR